MPNNTNSKPAKYPFKRTLYKGMKGRDVEVLQMWLDTLNDFYEFRKGKMLKTTGFFGDETQRFVKAFQAFVDFKPAEVNGVYNFKTHDLIQARYANMVESMGKGLAAGGYWNN